MIKIKTNIKQILIVMLLILLMSGIASAEQVEEWPHGQRNAIPDYIEGVMYDFEEGSNCVDFKNKYPEIATFLTVLGTQPYGSDWPSYVSVGGTTCGDGRCYMKIYPWCGYYPNGTPYEWVFITNGNDAFSPMTGTYGMGGYWPGTKSHIVFKDGTRYVSCLVCTGGNTYISLYDRHGNRICSEKITITIYRDGKDPSNWTQFYYFSEDKDIISMKISGPFNGHHLDDLIVGGLPGYLPEEPIDYSWAAERLKKFIGLEYLPYGTAWDYIIGDYRTAEEMTDDIPDPYFNFDYKQPELEFGVGINDQDAILYAFNGEGEELVNWWDTNKMAKQDFTEEIPYEEIQPGDVFFIDYPGEDGQPDGCYDEIGMVIEPMIDDTGDVVDIIRIIPEAGVHYSSSGFINALYGNSGFVDYRRLPHNPKGGHSPYKKIPASKLI